MRKISCKIDDTLTIELRNVRETYGHDDSTPFNADIYAYVDGKKTATYVGYAYNDGWGGMSTIKCENLRPIMKGLSDKMRGMASPYEYGGRVTYLPASLDFLIDLMVESSLYYGVSEFSLKDNFVPKP